MSTKLFRMFILSLVTVFALALFGCTEETVEGEVVEGVEGAVEGEGAEGEGAVEGEGAEGEGAEGEGAVEGEGEGAEGEGAEGEAEAAASFETPEAVFEALKTAMDAEDLAGVIKCYDPNGKRDMAAGMVVAVTMAVKAKKNKDKKETVDELLAKYEVPDMKKLKGNKKKKMKAVGEAITDVDGFLVDAMKFLETTTDKKPPNPYAEAELVKVKIKGEKATAKYKGAKGKPKPIKFIKVEESWFLAI
jgi:hypothetical protein